MEKDDRDVADIRNVINKYLYYILRIRVRARSNVSR